LLRCVGGLRLEDSGVRGVSGGGILYFIPAAVSKLSALLVRLSVGFLSVWLVEHSAFEVGLGVGERSLFWYLFNVGVVMQLRLFIFTWGRCLASCESLFRNARWLEREVGEALNVWYGTKRDRRALFLVPLLYWGTLRRYFPVVGFYELRVMGGGRIVAFHLSWLD
jgi:hypothetical protein